MTVLATAGHVDHGKSTFVNFLTGQEIDRLKEEKIRGLTINLGYTYFKYKNTTISIVDVPGHVDYFKNTIAGFSNVEKGESVIGGGTLPGVTLESPVLLIDDKKTETTINRLIKNDIPVLPRIFKDKVCLDLRSVFQDQDGVIVQALNNS